MKDSKISAKEAQEMMKEMKFGWKTPSKALREAFRRLSKVRPATEEREVPVQKGGAWMTIKVKIAKLTLEEILKMDNIVRAEAPKSFGLRPLRSYPVVQAEYNPTTEKATWKRLVGGEIIMESGKLPIAQPIWEECEGFDAAEHLDTLEPLIDAEVERMFPNREATKAERAVVRASIVQRKEVEMAQGPEPVKEDPKVADQDENSKPEPKKGKTK